MESAAAAVIQDAVSNYAARKRSRSITKTRKRVPSKKWGSSVPKSVYNFIRTVSTGQSGSTIYVGTNAANSICFKSGGITGQSLQMAFSMSSFNISIAGTSIINVVVPSYTEMGSLFDKYRIDRVDLYYTSSIDANNGFGGVQMFYGPAVCYTIDTDDSLSTTASDIMQYQTCKYTQFMNQTSRNKLCSFRPQAEQPMITSGTSLTGQASPPKNLWLDWASPGIEHYGVKFAIDQLNTTTQANADWYQVQFQAVYHIACKDVR